MVKAETGKTSKQQNSALNRVSLNFFKEMKTTSQSQLTANFDGDKEVELKAQSGENSQLFMENSIS